MNQDRNELDIIEKYQKKGYTCNFTCENNFLVELESKNKYQPQQITILREHRFEGLSNPSDMSILYVIETDDNLKGLVTASYGGGSDTSVGEFFKEIPKENDRSNENI
ncbi:hypothetical protein OS188_04640 [Xanthomarina sp. F1114]|uniref:hypothetical protein n=1 Tax=Xanthomarina sp. F1114 TaxID=2996019 RepID=UPI00225DEE79|nr:hypothetical protein [Xanthomarina sp. F1114]MCX7547236.1 hypothetical protein [Xanthomarina sp. F1114]